MLTAHHLPNCNYLAYKYYGGVNTMYSEFSDYAQKQYDLILRMISKAKADPDNASPACKVNEITLYTNVARKFMEDGYTILDQNGRKIEIDSSQDAILGTFYIVPPAKAQENESISLEGKYQSEAEQNSSDGQYMDAEKYDGIGEKKMPPGFDEDGNPLPFKEAFKERWQFAWEIIKPIFGKIASGVKKAFVKAAEINRRQNEKARQAEARRAAQLQAKQQGYSHEMHENMPDEMPDEMMDDMTDDMTVDETTKMPNRMPGTSENKMPNHPGIVQQPRPPIVMTTNPKKKKGKSGNPLSRFFRGA